MNNRIQSLVLALAFVTSSAWAADSKKTQIGAVPYTIDLSHSSIGFSVRHAFSKVPGNFGKYQGEIHWDKKKVENSKIHVEIEAASINTHNEKRDEHLRSADFFNVSKHPKITFVSKKIKNKGKNKAEITGDLTINGITQSVKLESKMLGEWQDPWKNEKASFEASTRINRKDFGLTWNKVLETGGLLVGEDVEITLLIEADKKKMELTQN